MDSFDHNCPAYQRWLAGDKEQRISAGKAAAIHESAFVRSFVVPEKRNRYLAKLRNQKTRPAFLDRLNHTLHRDLDQRFICGSPSVAVPDGDGLCYVLADEKQFDSRLISASSVSRVLSEAFFGVVVSCSRKARGLQS